MAKQLGNIAAHRFVWLAPTRKQYGNGGARLHIANCRYLDYGSRLADDAEIENVKRCKHCRRRVLNEVHQSHRKIGWLHYYISELEKELS